LHEKGIHVVSCDEKTGIQALERKITPIQPGQIERQDSNYTRHGTQCLIANFEVASGRIIAPTISDTRTERDFVAHIGQTINTDTDGKWVFIMDNLNTHQSESLVLLIARKLNITEDLGVKGKTGILKNMETRAKFLSDESHRIRIIYTPKHASWLNQIEIWFGTLSKRLLKRLSAVSTEELKAKMLAFIDYFNETMAKAYKWTYKGRPLAA
jgi:transposase